MDMKQHSPPKAYAIGQASGVGLSLRCANLQTRAFETMPTNEASRSLDHFHLGCKVA